ncbi:MAG: calcium-binding protein, partial [Sterolibacterium sp.]
YKIEKVQFDDGTVWDTTVLDTAMALPTGTTLYGTSGNDSVDLRNAVNTTVYGSGGSNNLGNDTYVFGAGSGQDIIYDNDTTAGNLDTIKIVGKLSSEVTLGRGISGTSLTNDLVIAINGTTDKLTVQNYFVASSYKIEQAKFDNGTTWTTTELDTAMAIPAAGTTYGTASADSFDLRNPANSTVYGYNGSDSGNDTYLFGTGAGQDHVNDYGTTVGNTDMVKLAAGIATDQLWFRHVANNLEVSIIGTNDKLILDNWYVGSTYHIEQFKTADGKLLLDTQVENLVQAMAAFTPPALGQTTLPQSYQDVLATVIGVNWQ